MVSVKWLVETTKFNDSTKALVKEVRRQGMLVKESPYYPFKRDKRYLSQFNEKDCVVFYGSLNFAKQIKEEAPWVPGAWCNKPMFECSYYYPRFGELLLNADYIMLPYGELIRKRFFLFDYFQIGDLFIRPSGGFKSFTGKVISDGPDYIKEIEKLGTYDVDPETMVVIAPATNIKNEWRLIVSDHVITGSRYKIGYTLTKEDNIEPPQEVLDYAENVLNTVDFNPDPIWILDICETSFGLSVLEVGTFSCAGFYNSDIPKIVTEASRLALEEYRGR